MKLTDATNEEALDMLAEILEPCSEIFSDPELKKAYEGGASYVKLIKIAIKSHKKAIIEIMATLDGVPVEEYKCNMLTLPLNLFEILNSGELTPFFQSLGQLNQ